MLRQAEDRGSVVGGRSAEADLGFVPLLTQRYTLKLARTNCGPLLRERESRAAVPTGYLSLSGPPPTLP